MPAMNYRWIGLMLMAGMLTFFIWLSRPDVVFAAAAKEVTNSCLSCHEDLYYLYDTGSLYCLTSHTDRCAGCHQGNPVILIKEDAHAGLLAHPQGNQGAKCRECHTAQETQKRISEFTSKSGGFDTVINSPAYTPSVETSTDFPRVAEAIPLVENWPWLLGEVVFFGLWLYLVLISPLKV